MRSLIFCSLCFLSSLNLWGQKEFNLDEFVYVYELSTNEFQGIIAHLEQAHKLSFSYSNNVVDPNFHYIFSKNQYTINELLMEMCEKQSISFIYLNNKILFVEKPELVQDQTPKRIYGFVKDADTGEFLIGATILSMNTFQGTITNDFGYFTSSFLPKHGKIIVSYIGYEPEVYSVHALNGRTDIELKPSLTLEEIIVKPEPQSWEEWIKFKYDKSIDNNPSLFGEMDVLRSIRKNPGIQSGNEVQGNLIVRGGGTDQNLILMDGIPLYEVNHLLGISSIFNQDAVNDVQFSNESFSPKYGGRLSSIINIQMKNGNLYKHKSSISTGLLGVNVHAEGPLSKGVSSYNFSARTTYINKWLDPLVTELLDIEQTKFKYSDLNFKFSQKLTENGTFSFSTYVGNDIVGFSDLIYNEVEGVEKLILQTTNKITWQNIMINARYRHIFGDKLFSNVSVSSLGYTLLSRSSNEFDGGPIDVFAYSNIKDINFRNDWEYNYSNEHKIIFGLGITKHTYIPTIRERKFISAEGIPSFYSPRIPANEQFLYLEDQYQINDYLKINAGFHLSAFQVEEENFNSFQPRFLLTYQVNNKLDLRLSYSKMTQYVHLLLNPGIGLPSDLWLPSTSLIPPQDAEQFSISVNKLWANIMFSSVSLFHKKMTNLVEYRSAADIYNPVINNTRIAIFNNARDWEDRVEVGNGTAYGFDFITSLNLPKVSGLFSYSYGKSDRIFTNINKGEPFPYKYDRRHDLSISCVTVVTNNLRVGVDWVFGTGHATTIALNEFMAPDSTIILNSSKRNNFRLPNYHRLDLNLKYTRKFSNVNCEFTFGTYNTYNRRNAYYVYLYENEEDNTYTPKQVSVFPLLPFINIKLSI